MTVKVYYKQPGSYPPGTTVPEDLSSIPDVVFSERFFGTVGGAGGGEYAAQHATVVLVFQDTQKAGTVLRFDAGFIRAENLYFWYINQRGRKTRLKPGVHYKYFGGLPYAARKKDRLGDWYAGIVFLKDLAMGTIFAVNAEFTGGKVQIDETESDQLLLRAESDDELQLLVFAQNQPSGNPQPTEEIYEVQADLIEYLRNCVVPPTFVLRTMQTAEGTGCVQTAAPGLATEGTLNEVNDALRVLSSTASTGNSHLQRIARGLDEASIWYDPNAQTPSFYIRRLSQSSNGDTISVNWVTASGDQAPLTPTQVSALLPVGYQTGAGGSGAAKQCDFLKEFYTANKTSGTNYSTGDYIVEINAVDGAAVPPAKVWTMWYNGTKDAILPSAPPIADMDRQASVPTNYAREDGAVATLAAAFGQPTEAAWSGTGNPTSMLAVSKFQAALLQLANAAIGKPDDVEWAGGSTSGSLIAVTKRLSDSVGANADAAWDGVTSSTTLTAIGKRTSATLGSGSDTVWDGAAVSTTLTAIAKKSSADAARTAAAVGVAGTAVPGNAMIIGGSDGTNARQVAALRLHAQDANAVPAGYGVFVNGMSLVLNAGGTYDRAKSANADAMAVTGLPANAGMVFNSTTWDRQRCGSGDAMAASGLAAASNMVFNSTTWDRLRSPSGDAAAVTGFQGVVSLVFNGTNYDRPRSLTADAVAATGIAGVTVGLFNGTNLDRLPGSAARGALTTSTVIVSEFAAAPTVTAGTAYASGNVLGSLQNVTGTIRNNTALSGSIQNVQVMVNTGGANVTSVDLVLFKANPSASTFTDRAALAINAADLSKVAHVIHLTDKTAIGSGAIFQSADLDRVYKVASGVTQLWAVLVVTGTPTFTATTDVSWAMQFQQH